ncbi:MAG: glycosyltransferase family 39 protein [Polyangiaceae bacterium]|nr:glycosyltransferase family 39 protein [Polyangiaceae bacterium]
MSDHGARVSEDREGVSASSKNGQLDGREWRLRLLRFGKLVLRRAHLWGAVLIFAFGFWLRGSLYLSAPTLWLDETSWAERLLNEPLQSLYVRPLGFMWLSLKVVNTLGYSELSLRLLPFLASCLTLPIFWLILRELIRSTWVQLVGLLLAAIHPWFIDYGVEFKPYAVELLNHLVCVWFCLRELRRASSLLQLSLIFAFASAAFLLGYNIVFLYPAFFLSMTLTFLRRPSSQSAGNHRTVILSTALCTCTALILWIRATALAAVANYDESPYWAAKYGVFFEKSSAAEPSRVDWYVQKYLSLTSAPSLVSEWSWESLHLPAAVSRELLATFSIVWLLLHFQGIWLLVHRKRWLVLCLLVTPTLTALVFNIVGKWPFGLFRTNVFMLGYFVILAVLGLDAWVNQRHRAVRWAGGVLALALILPSTVVAAHGRREKAWPSLETPKALALLTKLSDGQSGRIPLYCDSYSCSNIDAYTRYHIHYSKTYGSLLQDRYRLMRGYHVSDIASSLRRQRQGPAVIVIGRASELEAARSEFPALCTKSTVHEENNKLPLVVHCMRGKAE